MAGKREFDQILLRSIEAEKTWRIHTISQVHPQRSHRRAVANTKANRVHHVVEILQTSLAPAERKILQAGIDVPGIVEEYARDIVADQRKPQLGLVEE